MLKKDPTCHEAMFGLGKINFAIKRYELSEKWFNEAYLKRRDMAYRVWLGFTFVQLFKLVPNNNKRKPKFGSYAVKNLGSRCLQDPNYGLYANFAMLDLAIEATKQGVKVDGLASPETYIDSISKLQDQYPYEIQLAKAYHLVHTYDILDAESANKCFFILSRMIIQDKERPEAYYMIIDHFRRIGNTEEACQYAEKAISQAKSYHNYSER